MMYNDTIFLILTIIIASHTTYSLTTLNFGVWEDDNLVDVDRSSKDGHNPIGYDGWSSESQVIGETQTQYHGFWAIEGNSNLYRFFEIPTSGKIIISFVYIWGCDPEPNTEPGGDYAHLIYGDQQSDDWTWNEPTDSNGIQIVHDSAITADCAVWSKRMSFNSIIPATETYEITFETYQSSHDEFWGITDVSIALCITEQQLSTFDTEMLDAYLTDIQGTVCEEDIEDKIKEITILSLEEKYDIAITTETSNDDIDYLSMAPLAPQEVSDFVGDDIEQDIETIAEIFDQELADVLVAYTTDMTSDELADFCPKLNDIYANIVGLQRRLLVGINPITSEDNGVLIENDNFCSYTNRIKPDYNNDGEFEINLQGSVIKIPYSSINEGRANWRDENMDSIDVAALCVDNILVEDCNSFMNNDETQTTEESEAPLIYGDFSLNFDIYGDGSGAPFTFTLPFSGLEGKKACGWKENAADDWSYDGCKTTVNENVIQCECTHQTVFNLIQDLRTERTEINEAKALQTANIYLAFLIVYSVLALAATYLVVTLYRIKDIKKLASIIICVITLQIYLNVIQYAYLSFSPLDTVPLGITYCIISLPLLCHFWVCSLLILHWLQIFECAKTFNSSNKSLDYAVIIMNVIISILFIMFEISAMLVPDDKLSSIVSASNGVLGIVGISICIAWFYFGYKTATILMKSANAVKDSCEDALTDALKLRRRLLRLTFIIGLCFFTQSILAILSIAEHLQLFSEHFVNFATIWAVCDVVIFVTFILFYKTHVLRQKEIYDVEQQERALERQAKLKRRDASSTNDKSKQSAAIHTESSQSYGLLKRFHIPRISVFNRDESKAVRKSVTSSIINDNSSKSKPYEQPSTIKEEVEGNQDKMQTHLLVQQSNGTPTPSEERVIVPNPVGIPFDRCSIASNSTVSVVSALSKKSDKSNRHSQQSSQDDSCLGIQSKNRNKKRKRRKKKKSNGMAAEIEPKGRSRSVASGKGRDGKRKKVIKAVPLSTPKMTPRPQGRGNSSESVKVRKKKNSKTKKKQIHAKDDNFSENISKTKAQRTKTRTLHKKSRQETRATLQCKSASKLSGKMKDKKQIKKKKLNRNKKKGCDDNEIDIEIEKVMHRSQTSTSLKDVISRANKKSKKRTASKSEARSKPKSKSKAKKKELIGDGRNKNKNKNNKNAKNTNSKKKKVAK